MKLKAIALGLLVAALGLASVHADAKPKKPKKATAAAKADEELTREPPIAFYLADYGLKSSTAGRAIARCKARRAADRAKHPELAPPPKTCAETLVTVRGPYARGYEESEGGVFVYKGSDNIWYDRTGETSCFVLGTPVATPNGDVAIESLKVGDVVWSWDFDAQKRVVGLVERTKKRQANRTITITLADGRGVTATSNHPFFFPDAPAWVEADRLSTGDALFERSGTGVARATITTTVEHEDPNAEIDVIDITVSPHRNYFANGMLVHNY